MKTFWLVALTMVAFAANSILTRLGLADARISPAAFSIVRLASGAFVLAAIVASRGKPFHFAAPGRTRSVAALLTYVVGFSYAYLSLNAGVGALILFGAVQLTMFAGAALARETIPVRRWVGAAIAFGGLVWLLRPTGHAAPAPAGAVLMAAAGIAWGIYSMPRRHGRDPQAETAANFALAAPFALLTLLVPERTPMSLEGFLLALTSGAVTSGLGYTLWYFVLPQIRSTTAAVAQLTVPIIAMAGGALLIGEPLTLRFLVSALLVLGGIAFSLFRPKVTTALSKT